MDRGRLFCGYDRARCLGVRCGPSVKGLGATDMTPDRSVSLLLYVVAAAAAAAAATASSAELCNNITVHPRRSGQVFEGGGL